ncbi:unnamed protein product [Owenia fusiformis]|uniref:Uncharacterized protein n=1 Tax=Owenia fusiformis TaxID=6347 RepID=A0A8J1TWK7_OWEFU|nr:unnamed protein product [Owenia fusiformis]
MAVVSLDRFRKQLLETCLSYQMLPSSEKRYAFGLLINVANYLEGLLTIEDPIDTSGIATENIEHTADSLNEFAFTVGRFLELTTHAVEEIYKSVNSENWCMPQEKLPPEKLSLIKTESEVREDDSEIINDEGTKLNVASVLHESSRVDTKTANSVLCDNKLHESALTSTRRKRGRPRKSEQFIKSSNSYDDTPVEKKVKPGETNPVHDYDDAIEMAEEADGLGTTDDNDDVDYEPNEDIEELNLSEDETDATNDPDDVKSVENSNSNVPPSSQLVDQMQKSVGIYKRTSSKKKRLGPHMCKHCGESFKHGRPFNRHLIADHGMCEMSCRKCRVTFHNRAEFDHHKCKRARTQICTKCKKELPNRKRLALHMQLKHGIKLQIKIHKCEFCDRSYQGKESLYIHLRTHAADKQVCLRCGHFCDTAEQLDEHFETVHRKDCKFHCKTCDKYFNFEQQYNQHMKCHERHKCLVCNMTFPRSKLLCRHSRISHGVKLPEDGKSKEHTCEECGKMFRRPGLLSIHMRIHTGEKPIECGTCHLFFRTMKALRKHEQTNTHAIRTGDIKKEFKRDHLCQLCGNSYLRKQALVRHMKAIHTDKKPHQCPHCTYSAVEATALRLHMARHFASREWVCETCGAGFHTKKSLQTHHLYKHQEERTHVCTICNADFKTPNALRRHMRIHSTVNPFTCNCGQGFKRLYNLRRHMKNVHGSDEMLPPVKKVQVIDVPEDCKMTPHGIVAKTKEKEKASVLKSPRKSKSKVRCMQFKTAYNMEAHFPEQCGPEDLSSKFSNNQTLLSKSNTVQFHHGTPFTQATGHNEQATSYVFPVLNTSEQALNNPVTEGATTAPEVYASVTSLMHLMVQNQPQ